MPEAVTNQNANAVSLGFSLPEANKRVFVGALKQRYDSLSDQEASDLVDNLSGTQKIEIVNAFKDPALNDVAIAKLARQEYLQQIIDPNKGDFDRMVEDQQAKTFITNVVQEAYEGNYNATEEKVRQVVNALPQGKIGYIKNRMQAMQKAGELDSQRKSFVDMVKSKAFKDHFDQAFGVSAEPSAPAAPETSEQKPADFNVGGGDLKLNGQEQGYSFSVDPSDLSSGASFAGNVNAFEQDGNMVFTAPEGVSLDAVSYSGDAFDNLNFDAPKVSEPAQASAQAGEDTDDGSVSDAEADNEVENKSNLDPKVKAALMSVVAQRYQDTFSEDEISNAMDNLPNTNVSNLNSRYAELEIQLDNDQERLAKIQEEFIDSNNDYLVRGHLGLKAFSEEKQQELKDRFKKLPELATVSDDKLVEAIESDPYKLADAMVGLAKDEDERDASFDEFFQKFLKQWLKSKEFNEKLGVKVEPIAATPLKSDPSGKRKSSPLPGLGDVPYGQQADSNTGSSLKSRLKNGVNRNAMAQAAGGGEPDPEQDDSSPEEQEQQEAKKNSHGLLKGFAIGAGMMGLGIGMAAMGVAAPFIMATFGAIGTARLFNKKSAQAKQDYAAEISVRQQLQMMFEQEGLNPELAYVDGAAKKKAFEAKTPEEIENFSEEEKKEYDLIAKEMEIRQQFKEKINAYNKQQKSLTGKKETIDPDIAYKKLSKKPSLLSNIGKTIFSGEFLVVAASSALGGYAAAELGPVANSILNGDTSQRIASSLRNVMNVTVAIGATAATIMTTARAENMTPAEKRKLRAGAAAGLLMAGGAAVMSFLSGSDVDLDSTPNPAVINGDDFNNIDPNAGEQQYQTGLLEPETFDGGTYTVDQDGSMNFTLDNGVEIERSATGAITITGTDNSTEAFGAVHKALAAAGLNAEQINTSVYEMPNGDKFIAATADYIASQGFENDLQGFANDRNIEVVGPNSTDNHDNTDTQEKHDARVVGGDGAPYTFDEGATRTYLSSLEQSAIQTANGMDSVGVLVDVDVVETFDDHLLRIANETFSDPEVASATTAEQQELVHKELIQAQIQQSIDNLKADGKLAEAMILADMANQLNLPSEMNLDLTSPTDMIPEVILNENGALVREMQALVTPIENAGINLADFKEEFSKIRVEALHTASALMDAGQLPPESVNNYLHAQISTELNHYAQEMMANPGDFAPADINAVAGLAEQFGALDPDNLDKADPTPEPQEKRNARDILLNGKGGSLNPNRR